MFCLFCSVKYSELCLAGISQKSQPSPPPPPLPKKSIGARHYGFKNLYPNKKPATVTQQLQKSIDFRRIELYEFHFCILTCSAHICIILIGLLWTFKIFHTSAGRLMRTVPRDFRLQVFFMNQCPLSP